MLISLQALRGIFAIFIFLNHAAGFDAGGDVGVAFFFILSGFVLCNGYESRICERQISFRGFWPAVSQRFIRCICCVSLPLLSCSWESSIFLCFAYGCLIFCCFRAGFRIPMFISRLTLYRGSCPTYFSAMLFFLSLSDMYAAAECRSCFGSQLCFSQCISPGCFYCPTDSATR